jgi:hypothetical protein
VRHSLWLLPTGTLAALALAPERDAYARDVGLEWNTSADVRFDYLRRMPAMDMGTPTDLPLRTLQAGSVPSTGSQAFAVVTWDTGVVINGRWMLPIIGLQFGWAVGASSDVRSSLDGTMLQLRPSSADFVTLELPGIGMRFKARRWMLAAVVRPSATLMWMGATAADGNASYDLGGSPNLTASTFGVRADIEGCRRLDPVERACVFLAPAIYEFAPLNGGSIGIRMEFGP